MTQIATFAILILAANTAYADFPRLSSIIARDGYLPRQLANRGDRLVFSNGIIFLAVLAGVLIIVFKGNISALIPLYAFGVFTGFTLSQAGMVVHHFRLREPRWRLSAVINGVGCVATGIVALVVVVSKFTEGAWIPAVLIPALVVGFRAIDRHYKGVRKAVQVDADYQPPRRTHLVVVLVGSVHRGVIDALSYARSLAPEKLIAVSVVTDDDEQEQLLEAWDDYGIRCRCTRSARPTGSSPGPCSSTSTSSTPRAPTTSSPSSSPSSSPPGSSTGCTTSRRSPSRPACCTGRTRRHVGARCSIGDAPEE